MASPTIKDDGRTVTLDLHGVTVDEAVRLTRLVVNESARRGRTAVKVIHGSSTSDPHRKNRTIKYALYDALDTGWLADKVHGEWRQRSVLTLSLDLGAGSYDPSPLRLLDLDR